jgi:predicted amidophosphoribosyltransferase
MLQEFTIESNEFLNKKIKDYYHTDYNGMGNNGNPDYLNKLKNTFDSFPKHVLNNAVQDLKSILLKDLKELDQNINLTVCVVPRAKSEDTYTSTQLLFKSTVRDVINHLNFNDGTNYVIRKHDTKTTHLTSVINRYDGTTYHNKGKEPYPRITIDTCTISPHVQGKNILLIDDVYTNGVNIDEDAIQALLDNGANSVTFYAVAKA